MKKEEQELETGNIIIRDETIKKSRAKKISKVFLKYQKWLKQEYETTQFKEPVLFLIRRSGVTETHEDATRGLFDFTHSDGQKRFLILTGRPKTMHYGKRAFDYYICHEDHPLPLPNDPLITTEQMNISIEKALNNYQEWAAKQKIAVGKMYYYIFGGIALIVLAFTLYVMLKPDKTPRITEVQTVVQVINQTAGIIA